MQFLGLDFELGFIQIVYLAFMGFVFVYFLLLCFREKNNSVLTKLKYAPSIMTGLGLLGTFFELLFALNKLNVSDINPFIMSLKGVFIFSFLGIFSALFFMALNSVLQARQSYELNRKNESHLNQWKREQIEVQKHIKTTADESVLQNTTLYELSKNHKMQLENTVKWTNNHIQQMQNDVKFYQMTEKYYQQQNSNAEEQKNYFMGLTRSLNSLEQAMKSMAQGYDIDALGQVIAVQMGRVLHEPLNKMTQSQDALNTVLQDLKINVENNNNAVKDLGELVRENVAQQTAFIKQMGLATEEIKNYVTATKELQQEQKSIFDGFNDKLAKEIAKIEPAIRDGMTSATGAMKDTIDTATAHMTNTITGLNGVMTLTLNQMQQLQGEQKQSLEQFNNDLAESLNKIEPAIRDGMTSATNAMKQTIDDATRNMNHTLSETQQALGKIVGEITEKVLVDLKTILNDFNTGMDSHLNRMNTELENTGNRASNLMNQTATNLENSLGTIHETIEQSSIKLQEELKAFREEYQLRLNDFFEKQNTALEQTLGVQNKQLQDTAEIFNQQFTDMADTQKDINRKSQTLLDAMNELYPSSLNQMSSIAKTLNDGQSHMVKDLRDTAQQTSNINLELAKLGNEMPKAFTQAFADLNQAYIEKINESNQHLKHILDDMLKASAVLLTSIQANQND